MFRRYLRHCGLALLGALFFVSSVPSAHACSAETGCYGALAVGLWRTPSGQARVASGSANNYSSSGEAHNAAMRNCNSRGYNCHVVATFANGGCGFISTGSSYSGVGWGGGASRSAAVNQCESQGYSCGPPIGGCAAQLSRLE